MGTLRPFFLVTDTGFVLYWLVTALHLIPPEHLFKDYADPILVAWNWSFLPLDLTVSATGYASLVLHARGRTAWAPWALVSLVLTSCSGLMAIAFWTLRADFALAWWLPNLYLLFYPLAFLPGLVRNARR
ncbi:MAG: DUF5360 family protein [Candidatus Binatia bacterium]